MTLHRLTLRGVEFFELKIRISSRKRTFLQHHISLLIRGPGGLDCEIKNAKKSRDTATLNIFFSPMIII